MENKVKLSKRELKAQKFKQYKKKGLVAEDKEEVKVEEGGKDDKIKESEEKGEGKEQEVKPKFIKKEAPSKLRYIVFVGNLSFKTTKEEIKEHFKSCGEIISIRLMTDKQTGKSKGFAFLEFNDSKTLEKALRFHHTKFQYRQINVELSAGGGGKSENRQNKIKTKNEKLNKEREKLYKDKIEPSKRSSRNEETDKSMGFVNPERLKRIKKE